MELSDKLVGWLALTKEDVSAFQYDAAWIRSGFSISPYELPLENDVFIAERTPFDGGFGVFDDSLPDGWGSLVLDRLLRKHKINPCHLTLLDRLALVGRNGRGALEFIPDYSQTTIEEIKDIERLAEDTQKILSTDEYMGSGIDELYQKGGSPGGARPKIVIKVDGDEWLVKFPAKDDSKNIGKTEYHYAILARMCDVDMPETKLIEGKYFAVKRFDRADAGKKVHCVSAAALLRADYRLPSIDYTHLFQICNDLTRNRQELWRLYRLMCFNFLIGNKDDHAKNFSFLCNNGSWTLSPAYDLLPSDGINGYRTTSINDSIEPQPADLFAVAENHGLDKHRAEQVFEEMKSTIQKV